MCNAGKVFFESCGRPVLDAWRESAAGPGNGASQIVLVYGPSKQIFSAFIGADMRLHKPLPVSQTAVDQQPSIFEIAGEYWNFASFIPCRLYSPNMSIDALASYAVTSCIGELDIAIYRDNDGTFTMRSRVGIRRARGPRPADLSLGRRPHARKPPHVQYLAGSLSGRRSGRR